MKEKIDLLKCLLPTIIYDNFDCIEIIECDKEIHLYLIEKYQKPISSDYRYYSKGFTEEKIIQDYPIRGKASYLHVKRRKWLELESGNIITNTFDLTHIGTQLTHEFVAFLKGEN
jgi:hypothetical protein